MNLKSTRRARERILAVGIEGTGKSYNACLIARHTPDQTVFIIDNDNAYDRLLEEEFDDLGIREEYRGSTEVRGRGGNDDTVKLKRDNSYETPDGNLVVYHVEGWMENIVAIADAVSRAKREDWIVLDSLSVMWSDVATWFVEKIYGKGIDAHFMQIREARQAEQGNRKNLGALDGWMDYGVINPQYFQNVSKHLKTPPCHLYCTAEQAKISDEDDKDIRNVFGPYGVKPAGQKRNGHNMQTVFLFTKGRRDETFKVTSMKDRGRPRFENDEFNNIIDDYLVPIAGFVDQDEHGAQPDPVAAAPASKDITPKAATKGATPALVPKAAAKPKLG